MNEWISVKKIPVPHDRKQYIVCTNRLGFQIVSCEIGLLCRENITHWMPLPEPPKED